MSETGFGSKTYTPALASKDAGFGSPTAIATRDTGFGSPYDDALTPVTLIGENNIIGDDGGIRLDIYSLWYQFTNQKVPSVAGGFTVKFINRSTQDEYFAEPAYTGTARGSAYTNLSQTILHAYTPVLPIANYDIRITFGISTILILNAFRVVKRNRSIEQYSLRSNLPSFYKCGAVTPANESVSGEPNYSNLEAITRSFGQLIQSISSKPLTLTTADYVENQASILVETTLGFKDAGYIYVNGFLFQYTAKTDTSFTGVTQSTGKQAFFIDKKSKVVSHDK